MLDEAPADPDLVFEKALQLNTILHVRPLGGKAP